MKKILVVGCSFTRGLYGSKVEKLKKFQKEDLNPYDLTPTDILYDLLEEGGLDDFELYNVSVLCSSVATQAMIIQKYLEYYTPDFIVWQVTTPHRLGLLFNSKKFFNAIDPRNLQRHPTCYNKSRNNHYLLPYSDLPKFGVDPLLGGIWVNPGIASQPGNRISKKVKWVFDLLNKMNVYAVGEVGGYHHLESIQAQLYYTHALIENKNIFQVSPSGIGKLYFKDVVNYELLSLLSIDSNSFFVGTGQGLIAVHKNEFPNTVIDDNIPIWGNALRVRRTILEKKDGSLILMGYPQNIYYKNLIFNLGLILYKSSIILTIRNLFLLIL